MVPVQKDFRIKSEGAEVTNINEKAKHTSNKQEKQTLNSFGDKEFEDDN
jgi:hypothetical protein